MKKYSKMLALFLVLIMVFALAISATGCKQEMVNEDTAQETKPEATESSKESMSEGEVDTSEFVELKMLVLGNIPTNGELEAAQEEWNAILKDEINASLELQWIEWADWLTKYNLTLASGEAIDLVTTGDWLDVWPNVQRGAFMPLDDLLETYAPLTMSEISDESWKSCQYEGKTYFFPEDAYTQYVNHGVYYRGDWAKEFGIDKVNDFKTLGQYLQGVKDNKPDVIPYDANGTFPQIWNGWVTSNTDALELQMIPTGFQLAIWAKSYDEKYTAYSPIFDDTFVEFAKTMKEWSEAGYWRKDILNYTGDTREAFKAGQSGLDAHHTQTYRTLRFQMDELVPGSEIGFFPFSATRENLVKTPVIHGACAVGSYSENPERAVMAYEVIRQNEEFYHLLNYGREGVQYEVVDGKRTRPEGYDAAEHEFFSDFWGGRVDKFEIPTDTEYAGIYDLWAEFDSYAKADPYGRFIFNQEPVSAELAAISDVTSSLGPKFNWGLVKDVDAEVAEYREKLEKAGINKVLDEVNRQLAEYKAVIGE